MKADVKSFLADLKQVNDDNTVSIKVPSTNKKSTFKRFNVTQHKLLIRSAFDGVIGNIEGQNVFNDIIKENSQDEIDFLLCDKSTILLELRKASVGDTFDINEKTYNLSDLKPFDIADIELNTTIELEGIEVQLQIPTLADDSKINTKLIAAFNKLTDDQQRKQSIELILTYEIAKYISVITLGEIKIDFKDISVYEKINIINELPLKLNNTIIEYITKVRTEETKSLTFDDGAEVEIDAGFLTAD